MLFLFFGKRGMTYQIKAFENGIRVVHQEVNSTRLVHCGFILDIGSRDETEEQVGLAHFWEHMAFKAPKKERHSISLTDLTLSVVS